MSTHCFPGPQEGLVKQVVSEAGVGEGGEKEIAASYTAELSDAVLSLWKWQSSILQRGSLGL